MPLWSLQEAEKKNRENRGTKGFQASCRGKEISWKATTEIGCSVTTFFKMHHCALFFNLKYFVQFRVGVPGSNNISPIYFLGRLATTPNSESLLTRVHWAKKCKEEKETPWEKVNAIAPNSWIDIFEKRKKGRRRQDNRSHFCCIIRILWSETGQRVH